MKNRKRLAFAVAAMIVSLHVNGPADAAAPTLEQLTAIESHVNSGDFAALAAMLAASPDLMDASTALGQELSGFFAAYSTNTAFAFSPTTLAEMQTALNNVPSTVTQPGSDTGTTPSLY